MIPTIETERLILRGHAPDDFPAYCALWTDPDVVRFIGGQPIGREMAWTRFLRHAGMWAHMGFGFLAVTERQSGRFIGEAGFHEVRRDLVPSIEGTLEAGWALAPDAQGQGLASEAMMALVGWADARFAGRRMTCLIEPGNAASMRVAARLGFTEFARSSYHGADVVLFERG